MRSGLTTPLTKLLKLQLPLHLLLVFRGVVIGLLTDRAFHS